MAGNANSGNPNGNPNPSPSTRFGAPGGPDPKLMGALGGEKKWAVREEMRKAMMTTVDADKPEEAFKPKGDMKGAKFYAMFRLNNSIKRGDDAAMGRCIEDIEGKLPQTNFIGDLDLDNIPEEELDALTAELLALLRGGSGSGEEAGGGEAAADPTPSNDTAPAGGSPAPDGAGAVQRTDEAPAV